MSALVASIREKEMESKAEKEKILLQGVMDRVLAGQEAFQEHLRMVHEAILNPPDRELVKDDKTGRKIVRTIKPK